MKYYKAVSENLDGELSSLCCTTQGYQTTYKLGKFVSSPSNTPLFVFNDLEACKKFALHDDRKYRLHGIYECEVDGKVLSIKRICYCSIDFLTFWRNKKNKKKIECRKMDVPNGTMVTDRVKLTKLIQD